VKYTSKQVKEDMYLKTVYLCETKSNPDILICRVEPSATPVTYVQQPAVQAPASPNVYNNSQRYKSTQYDPYYNIYDEEVEIYRDVGKWTTTHIMTINNFHAHFYSNNLIFLLIYFHGHIIYTVEKPQHQLLRDGDRFFFHLSHQTLNEFKPEGPILLSMYSMVWVKTCCLQCT
jgi:hypothetical protein